MGSGYDIRAGRVTTAESTTDMLGAVPSEHDVDFNGVAILRATPQPGLLAPSHNLDGIHGVGHSGTVASQAFAQVQLFPQRRQLREPNPVTVSPTAIPSGDEPALPKDGRSGDLMVIETDTEDKRRACTLWSCVQGASHADPARWAQVLSGPSFTGLA
jgi:hypothetical protein